MTLIVAIKESENSILIAADGVEQHDAGVFAQTRLPKLRKVGTLVWGCTGDWQVAEVLSRGIRATPPEQWASLEPTTEPPDGLRLNAALLSGSQRTLMQAARVPASSDMSVVTLLAGWLNGAPGMWEVDAMGQTASYLDDGFCAIGGGRDYAEAIHGAVTGLCTPLEELQRIFRAVSTVKRSIGEPFDIWRIDSDGVEVLEGRNEDGRSTGTARPRRAGG